jgi:PAN domain
LASLTAPLQPAIAEPIFLPNTDMMVASYRHFFLPKPRPRLCQQACLIDAACNVWTFLHEGALGPLAVCYLKSGTPTPRPDTCCTSGAK